MKTRKNLKRKNLKRKKKSKKQVGGTNPGLEYGNVFQPLHKNFTQFINNFFVLNP